MIKNKDGLLEFLLQQVPEMRNIIDYLGHSNKNGDKFLQLMKAAQKYNGTTDYYTEYNTVNALSNIDNPIIIGLFVAIIRLINHFSFLRIHCEAKL